MLLEMDLDEIVPLLFFPDMVRSTFPKPSTSCTLAHSPGCARGLLQLLNKVKEAQGVLGLAHADDDRSANSPVDPNPCAKSADDFEARAHLHTILYPSNLASRHRSSIGRVRPILL